MDWTPKELPTISAIGEAAKYVYKKIEKCGDTWLIPLNSHPADGIHLDKHDPKSEGYGGSYLDFILEDGSTHRAKGPWHSNSRSLYECTGYDIRDKHLTFVVLSRKMEYDSKSYFSPIMKDVVYIDEAPTVGRFERYKELAKQYPQAKYFYYRSGGGGGYGALHKG